MLDSVGVAYEIRFTEEARSHLGELLARGRRKVLDRLDVLLRYDPKRQTRNLKALRPNLLARYELRIGDFRVFFDVEDSEEDKAVIILAIGRKEGNKLCVSGKEYSL